MKHRIIGLLLGCALFAPAAAIPSVKVSLPAFVSIDAQTAAGEGLTVHSEPPATVNGKPTYSVSYRAADGNSFVSIPSALRFTVRQGAILAVGNCQWKGAPARFSLHVVTAQRAKVLPSPEFALRILTRPAGLLLLARGTKAKPVTCLPTFAQIQPEQTATLPEQPK